jgi:putative transposase
LVAQFWAEACHEIEKRRVEEMKSSHWRRLLDEMFEKINGECHHLWRAVDHERVILESFVTKARDKKTALKFLRRAMRKYGRSETRLQTHNQ